MSLVLKNNASSLLSGSITIEATTLSIQIGDETKFPVLGVGQWFPLTVVDAAGNLEIMRCTGRSGTIMTVTRAQENTTAKDFAAGSRVDLRITAEVLAGFFRSDADPIPLENGGTGGATGVAALDNLATIGGAIASASTTNLSAATGMAVSITGTTAISSFGTEQAGALRVLTFENTLRLTHSENLTLPGGHDIITVSGDVAILQSLGAGTWRCLSYTHASGEPLRPVTVNALLMDSWGAIHEPARSLQDAYQDALDEAFGFGTMRVLNRSEGGTSVSAIAGGEPSIINRYAVDVLEPGIVSHAVVGTALNDLALGALEPAILDAIDEVYTQLTDDDIEVTVCTIPPFKGHGADGRGSFYTVWTSQVGDYEDWVVNEPATEAAYLAALAIADSVNAAIRATYPRVWDLWTLLNWGGANDGKIHENYVSETPDADSFHLKQAGNVHIAAGLVALANHPIPRLDRPRYHVASPGLHTDQSTARDSDVSFRSANIGAPGARAATLTIQNETRTTNDSNVPQIMTLQDNSRAAAHYFGTLVDGTWNVLRVLSGVVTPVLKLFDGNLGVSFLKSRFLIEADARTLRLSSVTLNPTTATGVALDFETSTTFGYDISCWNAGLTGFGRLRVNLGSLEVMIASVTKFKIGASGQVNLAYLPGYANNAAAIAGGLVAGDIYAITTDPYLLAVVR